MKLLFSCQILLWCLSHAESLRIASRERYNWCQEWDAAMSTRSATKLEEQMATLLAKMEEQGQQLRDLTQQQAERLDGMVTRQRETEEQIAALQGDLQSVKTLADSRLKATEDVIAELLASQKELGERQKLLREELQSELQEKVAGPAASDPGRMLSPTAPPFVPGSGSPGGGGEGAAYVTARQQQPAPYDGKSAWDAYHTQFELLAGVNRWSNTEKATYLAVSLRGSAATVLTNLPPDQRCDYSALTAALESRFGSAHQTELNRTKLKARARRRDEALPELAEDVERLTRLAYPDAAESMIEVLAKDQFIDSLADEDVRLRIRQNRPKTLREALETALELESYQLASKQRFRTVREAHLEEFSCYQGQLQNAGAEKSGDVVQQLVEALKQLTGNSPKQSPTRRECGPMDRSSVVCWNCKQRGHIRRDCRQRQQRDGSTAQGPGASVSHQDSSRVCGAKLG